VLESLEDLADTIGCNRPLKSLLNSPFNQK
jgi:hypothetical protein